MNGAKNSPMEFREVDFNKKKLKLGTMEYKSGKSAESSEKINLCFAFDDNYIRHAAAALASILLNSAQGNEFNIYVLDGDISGENKEKFKKLQNIRKFNLEYLKIDKEQFKGLPLNRPYISIAAYYRLLLPEILPDSVEKIIYLDCDTITERDIAQLWKEDISDKLAAVIEDEGSLCQINRLHLPVENSYFNSGILYFNIKKLREINFQSKWKHWYKDNEPVVTLQDQDILNGTLNGNCKYVSLIWNTNSRLYTKYNEYKVLPHQYSDEEADFAAHNPGIIHYTNQSKPWQVSCTHPLRNEYFKYLKYTPWKYYSFKYLFDKYIYLMQIFLKNIFSINNEGSGRKVYKVITICGLKLKFRNKKKESELMTAEKKYNDSKKMKIINEKDAITCRK